MGSKTALELLGKPNVEKLEALLDGPPVNCWTMARKLAASVLNKVVGVRREALVRLRTGFETLPPSGIKPEEVGSVVAEETAAVTTVESETTPELSSLLS